MNNEGPDFGSADRSPLAPVAPARERSLAYLVIVGVMIAGIGLTGGEVGDVEKPILESYRIPVNHAAEAELQLLPGVGLVISERIVSGRAQGGAYETILDFEYRVRGIGPVLAGRMEPYLDFSP